MIELLLANGADVNKHTVHNETALAIAAKSGKLQCARVLIAAGADVNVVSCDGATSLHAAVTNCHSAVAQLLLQHGGAVVMNSYVPSQCANGADRCDGVTALMMCTTSDTLKVALAAGADVHAATGSGDTCLHRAAAHMMPAPVVCLLIKAGVDIHAVNNKRKTAAQVAHELGNTLIEQLLNRAAQQGHYRCNSSSSSRYSSANSSSNDSILLSSSAGNVVSAVTCCSS
jgi:ankyrin repeat and SOCS box protein 5